MGSISILAQGYECGTWRIGGWLEGQGSAQEGLECNWGFKHPQWQRCKCAPGRAAGAHGTNGHYWRLVLAGPDFTVMHLEMTYSSSLVFAGARHPTSWRRQRQWLERKNGEWEWRGKCWARQHQGEEGQS